MDADKSESRNGLARLIRFLVWYGMAVATALFILPRAALLIESYYEAMSSAVRLSVVIGFVAVVTAWQLLRTHFRSS